MSHRTPPPPMDFSPPPSKQKSHMLSQYYIVLDEICHRHVEGEGLPYGIIPSWGSSAIGFLPGGGSFATWYYSPLGKFCYWISSGKVCHKVFLHGERLPYGIISEGTICHGICSLIKKCVCVSGGGGSTIEGEALPLLWYCFSPVEVLPCDFFRGNVCHMV